MLESSRKIFEDDDRQINSRTP